MIIVRNRKTDQLTTRQIKNNVENRTQKILQKLPEDKND